MKKHGHYCKICGEYKANEKFSGKGHAALGVGRGNKAPVMALGDAADDRKPQAEPC